MKAIQTLGLTKAYRSHRACDGVTLSVEGGEIFGFLGPNGAGKSTLVKMLVGLVHPSAGSARVLGLSYRDPVVRRQIGYLPELFRYPPWLTVREVMAFHADLLGWNRPLELIDQALGEVSLSARSLDRVKSLSKGLQQRLGLAVALLGEPRLVFLDEPTSALDPLGRHDVAELMKRLRAKGVTVFLNSHLLADMERITDSVALIDHGHILYTGSLDLALSGQVAGYRIHTGVLTEGSLRALAPWHPVVEGERGRDQVVRVTLEREALPQLHRVLSEHDVAIYEVEAERTSLEAWFMGHLDHGVRE